VSINIEDRTGQPRGDKEVREAIDTMKQVMIKHAMVLPIVTLQSGVIIESLEELLLHRKLLGKLLRESGNKD